MMYLIPAIGLSVNLHKCGKKIKVINLNSSHETKCPCGKEMPLNCCKDIQLMVKLNDNHKVAQSTPAINLNFVKLFTAAFYLSEVFQRLQLSDTSFENYHSPPDLHRQAVYLVIGVFRI